WISDAALPISLKSPCINHLPKPIDGNHHKLEGWISQGLIATYIDQIPLGRLIQSNAFVPPLAGFHRHKNHHLLPRSLNIGSTHQKNADREFDFPRSFPLQRTLRNRLR